MSKRFSNSDGCSRKEDKTSYNRVKKHRYVSKPFDETDLDLSLSDDSKDSIASVKIGISSSEVDLSGVDGSENESDYVGMLGMESVTSDESYEEQEQEQVDYYSYDSSSESDFSSDEEDANIEVFVSANPIDELKERLRMWSIQHKVTLRALSNLLLILQAWFQTYSHFFISLFKFFHLFPKDARTLLETNRAKYKV